MSGPITHTPLAETLGRFVATLTFDDLPPALVQAAKLRLLDTLGAAMSGIEARTFRPFVEPVAPGPATIWATGEKATPPAAAYLNSFVSHATYMEDGSRFCGGHPSSVVFPAVLAVAEAENADGRALIAAAVAGYEVFLRLGRATYPEIVNRGLQSTAALGAVAAAAATASLRQLGPEETAHALALAANLGFGLKAALKASSHQPVQVARSCEGGVIAAAAASRGARGAPEIFEKGLLPLFGYDGDMAAITAGLGNSFSLEETYIKRHGGCRGNHAPIDLVTALVAEHGITVKDIAAIDIATDSVTLRADIEEPNTPEQAQFSLAFSIAAALIAGDALPRRYSTEMMERPEIRAFMRRITCRSEPALDEAFPYKRGVMASIRRHDGTLVTGSIDNALGEPEQPLGEAEVLAKFTALSSGRLRSVTSEVAEIVLRVEKHGELLRLHRLLS